MKRVVHFLIRKPTLISVAVGLYFIYILFLIIYKQFNPPKIGSAYNMILETLLMVSFFPLGLLVIDRLLVLKIKPIKLTIIEAQILGSFYLYHFPIVHLF